MGVRLNQALIDEARSALEATGSQTAAASLLGIPRTTLISRLQIEDPPLEEPQWSYPRTTTVEFDSGVVFAPCDAHYWPNSDGVTLAHRALLVLCKSIKPRMVILNGDLMDFGALGKHSRFGWDRPPTISRQLAEAQARTNEIADAASKAQMMRTVGNHDFRYDRYLATAAPQFENIPGLRLSDHLPRWPCTWSIRLNGIVIKHRWHQGMHAAFQNVVKSGTTIVTGHTHRLNARPFRDYTGLRWGIKGGMLNRPTIESSEGGNDPFEYGEDNPQEWTAGFPVLTWHKGKLLPPEFCVCIDGCAWFRGYLVASDARQRIAVRAAP
jgi:hypothetical protein